ncbi:MAG TPA: hypothetical protein VN962_09870 [Polyangia bacterium]|nr:hypothetical protein [Polyangia bacterium]
MSRAPLRLALLVAVSLGAASACQKHEEGSGKPSPVPPLDPASAPATPAPAAPAPAAPPAPSAAAPAAGGSIAGKIVLAPAIAKTKPAGTLYLVARRISDNPSARGTLIAVKKMPASAFPLPFSLTAADMPFQTGPFDGELTITARIDQDGDPMTHQKGDVLGTLPKVQVGAQDVKLTLDQVQKENESLAGGGPMMGGGALPPGHP